MSFINETADEAVEVVPLFSSEGEITAGTAEVEDEVEGTLNVNDSETPVHLAARIYNTVDQEDDESEQTNDDWDWGEEDTIHLEEEPTAEEASVVSEETKKRRIEGGEKQENDLSTRTCEVDPVNFPIAKLKALFKVGYTCGGHGGSTGVALSGDALATLNQAVALLIEDLAESSLNKAPPSKGKRSLTYQDLTDNALQLERFSYLQGVIPPQLKEKKSRNSQQTMDAFLGSKKNN